MKERHYLIDFREVTDYYEMHYIIREALGFPYYYGFNWDAFWDCLTEMCGDPMKIEILGFDVAEKAFGDYAKTMIETLTEFKHIYNDKYIDTIKIEIVRGDKREVL